MYHILPYGCIISDHIRCNYKCVCVCVCVCGGGGGGGGGGDHVYIDMAALTNIYLTHTARKSTLFILAYSVCRVVHPGLIFLSDANKQHPINNLFAGTILGCNNKKHLSIYLFVFSDIRVT